MSSWEVLAMSDEERSSSMVVGRVGFSDRSIGFFVRRGRKGYAEAQRGRKERLKRWKRGKREKMY